MNYVRKRRLGRTPYTTPNTATDGQPQPNEWTNNNQTSGPTTATQTGPTHGNNWPLPHPLPRREGRDYRDTPNGLPLVAYGAICGCIIPCSAHSVSYLRYIKILVNGVYSVILCLYVIMSITIKNTTKHVLSVILCHSVILSINIKNTAQYVLSVIICLYVILSLIMFASRGGGVFH